MHTNLKQTSAQLAELVDALDSNSSIERCAGSIPALGTKNAVNLLISSVLRFYTSILEGRNVKVIPSKNLKEQSFGDFEAEKSVDIFKDGVRFPDGYRFCGGENHSDVIERVTNELKKIASEYPNANVLVVCHGSAIKHIVNALCPGFVDEKPNTAALVPNCSVTRMDCDTELKLIEKPHLFHGQQTLK